MWPPEVKRAYVTGGVPDEVFRQISRNPSKFQRAALEYYEGYQPRIHGFFSHQRYYGPRKRKYVSRLIFSFKYKHMYA